jgi:hypothetical protein
MILGMSTSSFTLLHVILSLIGIAAGFVVVAGMFGSKPLKGWTALFLAATILTSVTGYFFPNDHVTPAQILGAVSLVVLAIAVLAYYGYRFAAAWRWVYVVTALVALYLNVFVLVAQSFQKLPWLHALAPTQAEPPFVVTQLVVLVAFVAVGFAALRAFHPVPTAPELRPR